MTTTMYVDGFSVDLTNCDKEPIHVPGAIQPHGVLLALQEPDLSILQVSRNVEVFFNTKPEVLLNQCIDVLLSETQVLNLELALKSRELEANPLFLFTVTSANGKLLNLIAHRFNGILILEMEPAFEEGKVSTIGFFDVVKESLHRVRTTHNFDSFFQVIAREIKRINGFDRVMVYKFDEHGNGSVIAEEKEDELEPYLGLHYPATDIPKQARELYLRNMLRLICDINYRAAELVPLVNPKTGKPLDMSYALLRSVSPIHIQYLQNMQVGATMTISIIKEGQLWGLIACHHYSPRYVPYEIRTACELMGYLISLELAARVESEENSYRLKLQAMQTEFVEQMSREDNLIDGLMKFQPNLSDFINAEGAAISLNRQYQLVGNTPTAEQVKRLIGWLRKNMHGDILVTNSLSSIYPAAIEFKDKASGLLAITISPQDGDYVLWFRPEEIQTVHWAGDPSKPVKTINDGAVLTPRASFELWKETVKLKSIDWKPYESQAALEIRHAIMRILLRKSEELIRTNVELERRVVDRTTQLTATNKELEAFSYSVSHDLRAPLRALDGYSQALLEEAGERLTEREKTYLQYIREGSQRMGCLIEDLIKLSRITRDEMRFQTVDLTNLGREIIESLSQLEPDRQFEFTIDEGMSVMADASLIKIMLENLLSNAWKFTKYRPVANISFTSFEKDDETIYCIEDNGAGFKSKYVHKIFGAFQRLHKESEFPGTGIGLATVQRVVHRHGGQISADAEVGKGARFCFTLNPHILDEKDARE